MLWLLRLCETAFTRNRGGAMMNSCRDVRYGACPAGPMRRNPAIVTAAALLASSGWVLGGTPRAPGWEDVSAIFSERCVMCHSDHGAGLGLRLDSYEFALAGSKKGPVLIAGDAERSEMVRRLRGLSTPRMPFLGRPLPEDELDVIVRWIEAGLPRDGK